MKDETRKIIESQIWEYLGMLVEERNIGRLTVILGECTRGCHLINERVKEESGW